ncbi:hypothetical protein [Dehalobacter restrictus]|jgi:hypothetical protein|uniref:hypothetical protein n=1 Tax=Dehalobacter restrictus TaxID=55583 RepID=UPI000B25DBD3
MNQDYDLCHCGNEKKVSEKECNRCNEILNEWINLTFKKGVKNLHQREAKCWSCKTKLSTLTHKKCPACNWIKCACGACGCNIPQTTLN